jgi:hypothetical protein
MIADALPLMLLQAEEKGRKMPFARHERFEFLGIA